MTRIKKACKNHPERLSSRKCYYCHAFICSACQHTIEHHIFCGRWCYLRWKSQRLFERLNLRKLYDFPSLLLLALIILLFLYFNHKISSLTVMQPRKVAEVKKDSIYFRLDSTFRPTAGRTSFVISVSPGLTASLWHNGKLLTFARERSGQIVFKDIPLRFGKNKFIIWAHQENGQTSLIDSLTLNFSSARLRYLGRPVQQVRTEKKWLALTFDAGSTSRGATQILNILKEKRIHCTMFITGRFLSRFPEIVRQMIEEGHEMGNHTFSHPHLTTYAQNGLQHNGQQITRALVMRQLLKVDSLYVQFSGRHLAPFWRAPFGEYNTQILTWAAEAGFKHIGWSAHCDALDWTVDSTRALYRSSQDILRHFLDLEKQSGLKGKIILMHLGTDRKNDFPYLILPALIDSLQNRGYRFVTVSELLNSVGLP